MSLSSSKKNKKPEKKKGGVDARENENFSQSNEPAMVFAFAMADGDPHAVVRDQVIKSLESAGFLIAESDSRDGDEKFIRISVPSARMLREAEKMELKCRLKQAHGGGLHTFNREQMELFDVCSEGTILSSAQQLIVIDGLVQELKEKSGTGKVDIEELMEKKCLNSYFRMHYEPTRMKLEEGWAFAWTKKQPLELIREYFGEKVSLYFDWLGLYTTMLWVPALTGVMMSLAQLYTSLYTGSLDNPWVPCYCVFLALWAVAFLELWKREEESKKLEWYTSDFEEQEEDRPEFEKTHTKRDKITGQNVFYYPDWKRAIWISLSVVVVLSFVTVVVAVVLALMVAKYVLTGWFGSIGAGIGSGLNAVSIMIFNSVYSEIVGKLNDLENWRTETEYEDALIAKDFCFKFVNSYFALFFVAFIQNHAKIFGYDLHCPDHLCMPVLTMTLGIVFGTQIFVQQSMEIGMPIATKKWNEYQEEKAMLAAGKDVVKMKPEEEQAKMEEYEGVFDDYNEMVVQFGYVTLFAAAFPMAATLALLNNIIEIRIDAMKMVTATQRAEYAVAADIGTWMTILELMTTCAIMTNTCLVGFTSNGLYFFFPDMSGLQKVWIVIAFEHALLGLKLLVEVTLGGAPEEAEMKVEAEEHFKKKALKRWQKRRQEAEMEDLADLDEEEEDDGDRR